MLGVFTELLDSGPTGAEKMNAVVKDICTSAPDLDEDDEEDESTGGRAVWQGSSNTRVTGTPTPGAREWHRYSFLPLVFLFVSFRVPSFASCPDYHHAAIIM